VTEGMLQIDKEAIAKETKDQGGVYISLCAKMRG